MIGVVIFSRLSSSRLPDKALMDMGGRPLLGRILDRLRRVRCADKLIVATSIEPSDDALAAFVDKEPEVDLFRGSLDDVSGRTLACMRAFDLDALVRICGDSPFEDPTMIDSMITLQNKTNADIASNVFVRTFPSGLSVEVISRTAYERAYPLMSDPKDFEHVTYYLYQHPEIFHIETVASEGGKDLSHLNLCVDTQQDFVRAVWIARQLGDGFNTAGVAELIKVANTWYAAHPEDTTNTNRHKVT